MKKFLFLLIILCFTVNAYAAKIKLKTGMVVTCDIIAKTDKYVEVDFRGTNVKFYFDEIDQIIEDAVSPEKAASTEETGAVGQKKDGFFGIAALGQNFLQSQKKKMQSSRTCSLRPVSD
ncbi:MAG: hypothetical protein PHY73_04950 [Candidatus Omnitrophica bacterium]|nr:hypothetical protein [Candidatus Omnitrophota bacterium]